MSTNTESHNMLDQLQHNNPAPSKNQMLLRLISVLMISVCIVSIEVALGAKQQDQKNAGAILESVLDGKSFKGQIGVKGKPGRIEEQVYFNNGLFVSEECERRCGYTESQYWFRYENQNIHFKSRSYCNRADAWIDWSGVVTDEHITGKLIWTSQRWYWTTEKEFWFEGRLVKSVDSGVQP